MRLTRFFLRGGGSVEALLLLSYCVISDDAEVDEWRVEVECWWDDSEGDRYSKHDVRLSERDSQVISEVTNARSVVQRRDNVYREWSRRCVRRGFTVVDEEVEVGLQELYFSRRTLR